MELDHRHSHEQSLERKGGKRGEGPTFQETCQVEPWRREAHTARGIPQSECKREILWLEIRGTFLTGESPFSDWLLCSLSVLTQCQDCKIFLMTGHILHLDSMVETTRSFLSSLVEVHVIESWGWPGPQF